MHMVRLTTRVALVATVLLLGVAQATAWQTTAERISGEALVAHPIAALAAQYLDALHAGKADAVLALATKKAQAQFKAEPASEQKASLDFRRKVMPTRAELEKSLPTEGVLLVEADGTATLNIVKMSGATSTTVGMPFAMEDGKWKLAR